jgi:hypothetical protein
MERDAYVYRRETRETVNMDTGEVIAEQRVTKQRVAREPQFVKLYLSHVLTLIDIPKGLNGILYELLRNMNYDNEIVWNQGVKMKLAEKLNCSESNVKKAITSFKRKGILIEQYPGVFLVNPYVFGKGSWENVHQLRLTVDITAGKQILSGTVVNDNYTERINNNELDYREQKELSALKAVFAPSCCPGKESEEEICGIVTLVEE